MKRKFNLNNIISVVKDFILNNKVFLIFVLLSLLIGFFLRLFTIGWPLYFKALACDFIVILCIGSFSFLLKESYRYYYYLFWIILSTALTIGNTVYYDFYESFISVNLLGTASMVGQVNDALWAKLHVSQFLYILFPIIFIVCYKLFIKYNMKDKEINGKKYFIVSFILSIVLGLCVIPFVTKTEISRFIKLWNRESVVQKYGLYVYTINDLVQSVRPKVDVAFGYDEDAYIFRNYYACKFEEKKSTNEYTNIFKGKNILFIHGESIQNFLINLKINGQEVTPNLNKLVKNSLYFNKFYPQISVGTSSDTEFTLNTGLMPSSSGTVFVNYFNRTYASMPKYFKSMGYYTFSTHANNADYWNRKLMHASLGYDDFYAKDSFVIPNNDDPDYVGLGLSDKSFFKQLMPILNNINSEHTNYMGTIITLSNHSPFNDVTKYGEFDLTMDYTYEDEDGNEVIDNAPYLEGSSMGNYLKSAHYADSALGDLFDLLEANKLLDNTVIVFYGDHEARLSRNEFDRLYNYDPVTRDIMDPEDERYQDFSGYNYDLIKNTPLIIYSKSDKVSGEISKVMGMYDVLPTIANMFGFEEKYSLGHDIFSDREGIVVFPNGNVLTDKVYYSDLKDEYIAFNEEPIEIDYINNLKDIADRVLDVSNGIVVHDLIKREANRIGECVNE